MEPSIKLVGSIILLIFGIILLFVGLFFFIFPYLFIPGMFNYITFGLTYFTYIMIPIAILLISGIIGLRSYRKIRKKQIKTSS